MRMILLAVLVAAAALGFTYRYFALEAFNFLVPTDDGTILLAQDVAFGPDQDQKLDIYAPEAASGVLPVLVFVHGGSWESGSKNGYGFVGRTFAAQGYLTLVADYRKRPKNPYPAFIEDAALALAFAEKHAGQYGGDASMIFAVGHSAGAYNLTQAMLDKRYLEAAGVDEDRIRAVATLAGPFDFLPLDTRVSIETFGDVADLPGTQPVNFARRDAPPFLLLTGTEDTTVRPRNSLALQKKLSDAGAVVELRQYHGITHAGIMLRLAKPLRSPDIPVLQDIAGFFRRQSKRK